MRRLSIFRSISLAYGISAQVTFHPAIWQARHVNPFNEKTRLAAQTDQPGEAKPDPSGRGFFGSENQKQKQNHTKMSAYIVDKDHILYLVEAAMSRQLSRHGGQFSWYHGEPGEHFQLGAGDYERAAEVANMLWQENIKSVSARYPNESSATLPGPVGEDFVIASHDFSFTGFNIEPVQVLASCDCYVYQSCEHEGWQSSEAHAFIERLRSHAWHALPGYDKAEWGAPKRMNRKIAA